MKRHIHRHTDESDNFLVLAPTYKIMQQSTLPPFLQIMHGCGHYSKADAMLKVHGGGTVYFRTGTDPDSIVGITNIRAIWGDEAGLYGLYFWENIQARAAFKKAPILLTTSPYTLNWLYKEIIRPKLKDPKARPDTLLIQASSAENPYFPREVYDRNRETMDPRRFNAMFGGQWERMSGLVYDCFDEVENQCEPLALPSGSRIVGGIDWGFTEPFVFKVRGISPGGYHFGMHELYRSMLTITDICRAVGGLCTTYGVSIIYCGQDQPGYIEELNRYFRDQHIKCSAVAADNDVRVGIDRHYELIKTRRLKYFRGMNPYTMDEIETYHYPEPVDVAPDKPVKDQKPVQQHDHAMDADRYISMMTYNTVERRAPIVPEERQDRDQFARLERLKRLPRVGRNTEVWG